VHSRYIPALLFFISCFPFTAPSVSAGPRNADGQDPSGIVKEIRTDSLRRTRREIVIRELVSKVGEPYSEQNTDKDIERLDRLGIFSDIRIEPVQEADGIILDVLVKEMLPYLPAPSFDTTDESGFTAGVSFRALNLRGRDISFAASAKFGDGGHYQARIENPWFWGNHGSYLVQYDYRDRYNGLDDFQEKSSDFLLQLGSYIGDKGRIGGRFGFYAVRSDTPGITLSSEGRDIIPTLAFYLGYDSRDLWTYPRRGWWSEIEIAKNGGFLGGSSDFWSFTLDIRRYQPLAGKHSLAFYSLTTYRTGTVGEDLPIHQDFHLGGSNTIRGWDLDAQHGKSQFINTLEYRYLLMEPRPLSFKGINFYLGLQLAAFGDFGIAWDRNSQFELNNFIDGYGFGARVLVPFIDVIRFDFAFGEPDQGIKRHITLGWKPEKQRLRVR